MHRPIRHPAARVLLGAILPLLAAAPAAAQEVQLSGWLHVLWADGRPGAEPAGERYVLVDDAGRATELALRPGEVESEGGVLALNRRRVTVRAERAGAGEGQALRATGLRADASGARFSVAAAAQTGPRPFVTILCRFGDSPAVEPKPRTTYERWLGAVYPGLDEYWREASGDRVGVAGSAVSGWHTLPRARSYYFPDGRISYARLVDDCTGVADAEVHFPSYAGVNLQFNGELDGYSWGGSWTLVRDGQTRTVGLTWMASWATQMTYAHEAGHAFGLPHSSGPYADTYDSRWDVMSSGGLWDAEQATHVANHPIAYHKDLLGWIAPEHRYVAEPGTSRTVVLERTARAPAGNFRMAQVPIPGTRHFYTVEARRGAGYDGGGRLPAEAVVLHRVDPQAAERPARVVDADGNGDPNDDGAAWTPGESFTDAEAGITIAVEAATATGFRVRISLGGAAGAPFAISSDSVRPSATVGRDYADALQAAGAPGAVAWTLSDGALPPGVALEVDGVLRGVPTRAGVFRFTAAAASGGATVSRAFTLPVQATGLRVEAVLDHLMGAAATLTDEQVRLLDLEGNRNGRLDLGDVRAWMLARGQAAPDVIPGLLHLAPARP
jgi:M6 family metalloprotease-like protein